MLVMYLGALYNDGALLKSNNGLISLALNLIPDTLRLDSWLGGHGDALLTLKAFAAPIRVTPFSLVVCSL